MLADSGDRALVEDYDHIRLFYRSDSLRDDDLCGFGDEFLESGADERVGAGVYCACRVVEDEDLRLFQKCAGNTKALLLTARDVRSALLDEGIVAIGKGGNEIVRLSELASLDEFLVGSLPVTPAKIFLDGAREEKILLQNHRNRIAESAQIVFADVNAANLDTSLGRIIKTRNELYERGLRRARAADDTDGHTRFDMNINVGEGISLCLFGILEVDRIKVDRAVLDLGLSVCGTRESGLFSEDFIDSLEGLGGHCQNYVDHREHHQRHQDLHTVGKHSGELTDVDVRACARDDEVGAEGQHEYHIEVKADLHNGRVEGNDALGFGEVARDVLACRAEAFALVILTRETFDNSHTAHVFLDGLVEAVVFLEHAAESGHCLARNEQQTRNKHGNDDNEGRCKRAAHNVSHGDREDEHQRRADRGADYHHIGHLNVSDVGGQTCDERSGREFIDVLEGVGLDLAEKIAAKVLCKSRACLRTGERGNASAGQRDHCHQSKQEPCFQQLTHLSSRLDAVDKVSGYEWDQNLNYDLADNEDEGQYRGKLIFPDTAQKSFYHCLDRPFCHNRFGKIYRIIYYTKNKLINQYQICRKE